jgi:hypothetical protein
LDADAADDTDDDDDARVTIYLVQVDETSHVSLPE